MAWVWAALAIVAAGCGSGATPQLTGDGGTAASCDADGLYCAGPVLRRCVGKVADTVTDCDAETLGGACSRKRCTSPACEQLELNDNGSARGCLFYAAKLSNVAADADETDSLLVTNSGPEAAWVDLETLSTDGERRWTTVMRQMVPPEVSRRFRAPFPAAATQRENRGVAVRINSDQPVTVVQIQSDDADESATNSGATVLLPVNTLGKHHFAMTYPQRTTAAVAAVDDRGGSGFIMAIGVADGTTVTLKRGVDGTTDLDQVALDDGDVALFWSGGEGDDLSGIGVNGTNPIAVLSGNLTTTYGREITRVSSPDMALEQLLPVAYWSTLHVAAALTPQASTCDTLLGTPGASIWRVMAAEANTQVTFYAPPAAALPSTITLGAGEIYEAVVPNVSFVVESAGGPVMVMQGMDCEPSLSPAVSLKGLLGSLSFAVLPSFAQTVAVVRPRGTPVKLDNTPLDGFVSVGKGYEVAQVPIGTCTSVNGVCTHTLDGAFGMTMRGMDVVCGYALTMPTWEGCDGADMMCVQ